MAVTWNVKDVKRGSVYLFDAADIVIKPDLNGRHELPDIAELKASILEHGQLEPVAVRNEGNKPVLVMGFSRWRAIAELNQEYPDKQIKLQAVYIRCDEVGGLLLNHEENRRRNQTTALDDAHLFARLERYGWEPKEIALKLKVTPAFVRQRLSLIEATLEVKEALRSGRIKAGAAAKIAKLATSVQREAVKGNGKVSKETVAAATHTTVKPSFRAVREYVEAHTGPGESKDVAEFCDALLRFMDGKQ
jgi:ParB/RepB/Spo0J family partition protein